MNKCVFCIEDNFTNYDSLVPENKPCEECLKTFNKGVSVISVSTEQLYDSQPPIITDEEQDLYYSGRYVVYVTEDAKKIFEEDLELEDGSTIMVSDFMFDLLEPQEESEE